MFTFILLQQLLLLLLVLLLLLLLFLLLLLLLLLFQLLPLLSEGKTGKTWEPSYKTMLFHVSGSNEQKSTFRFVWVFKGLIFILTRSENTSNNTSNYNQNDLWSCRCLHLKQIFIISKPDYEVNCLFIKLCKKVTCIYLLRLGETAIWLGCRSELRITRTLFSAWQCNIHYNF